MREMRSSKAVDAMTLCENDGRDSAIMLGLNFRSNVDFFIRNEIPRCKPVLFNQAQPFYDSRKSSATAMQFHRFPPAFP